MTDNQTSFAEYVRRRIVHLCVLVVGQCIVFTVIFALTASSRLYVVETAEISTIHVTYRFIIGIAAGVGAIGILLLAKSLLEFTATSDQFLELERLATLGKFSAWTAHQIRNPLAVIRAQGQMLSLQSDDDATRRASQLIMRQSDKMGDLLSLMMTLSQPVLMQREVVALEEIFSDLLETYRATYPRVEFLQIDKPTGTVIGHAALLEEAFKNVLTNAVENIGDDGGGVTIVYSSNAARVTITITDSGPTISKKTLESAFEIGYTNKRYGTGLGLPIVKTILTAHGGSVQINRAGQQHGTMVTLELPHINME